MVLTNAIVSRVHGDPKYKARFQVKEFAKDGDGRTFELRAHSDEEMHAWCDAIQSTVDLLTQLTKQQQQQQQQQQ